MHPALTGPRGFLLYLAMWSPIAGLLIVLLARPGALSWEEAALTAVPLTFVYAELCLGAWYVCRAIPLRGQSGLRTSGALLVSAVVSSSLWLLASHAWFLALAHVPPFGGRGDVYMQQLPMLFVLGVLLFGLSLAVYYLLIAFQATRDAENRALEARVLAAEAELRALRAQIDPHFIFNSLHSIGALAGADPAAARNMSLRLAEFLRATLTLGAHADIALADEIALAEHYLSVEQVRFGSRLRVRLDVADDTRGCRVPPLLCQPLVENAVTHGIAHLVEGGTITIAVHRDDERLSIAVENPCDPDRRSKAGTGVGLTNVRRRLEALFGREGGLDIERAPDRFRVLLTLPLTRA
jgi:two-component system sensor histidine kinase AlgZ